LPVTSLVPESEPASEPVSEPSSPVSRPEESAPDLGEWQDAEFRFPEPYPATVGPLQPQTPAEAGEPPQPEEPAAPEEPLQPEEIAGLGEPAAPEEPPRPEEPASPEELAAPEGVAAPEQEAAAPQEPAAQEEPAAPDEPLPAPPATPAEAEPGEELPASRIRDSDLSAVFSRRRGAAPGRRKSLRVKASILSNVARLEADMNEAPDRDQLVETALRLATVYARAAAIFVVHRDSIRGYRVRGNYLGDQSIDDLAIPIDSENYLSKCVSEGESLLTAPDVFGADSMILNALGRGHVREIAVLPVKIKNRVINVLHADNGSERMGATSFAALQALARCMAKAYALMIVRRKK
jgi:hypothetical protein